jgi:predicted RNA-binding protein with PIN domain
VPDETLYLFDGFNVFHAGAFADVRQLVDLLAGFVAMEGARGVVVFDGVGTETTIGSLEVRYAPHADALLERLAAEHRSTKRVCLVSSDAAVRGTAGVQVKKLSSATFLGDLESPQQERLRPSRLEDRLDEETRAKLERMRRGQSS